jgi:hypothetical protein
MPMVASIPMKTTACFRLTFSQPEIVDTMSQVKKSGT